MKMKEEKGTEFKNTQLSISMSNNTPNNNTTSSSSTKRLLFDRRYGWVIDEWKNPSEEALAGGRGMFCVVPLAKGLIDLASYSINTVANSAIEILERRDRSPLQNLQSTFGNQLQRLAASIQKPNFGFLMFKGKHSERGNMQEVETV